MLFFSDEEDVDWHLTSFIHVRNVAKNAELVKEFGPTSEQDRVGGETENLNTTGDTQNMGMDHNTENSGIPGHPTYPNGGLKKILDKNISISRPFSCPVCEKIYTSKLLLENHNKNVHLGIKNYSCSVCGKYFTTKVNLNRHKTIHTDSCLKCEICGKTEMDKKHLDQHMVVHSNIRNFVCECGKAFKRNGDLTQHKGRCQVRT